GHSCYNPRPNDPQGGGGGLPLFYGRSFAMSTPAPAEARLLAASQKQLEELDALLERMLQLPVIDEEPAAPISIPTVETAVASAEPPQDPPPANELPHDSIAPWEGAA